MTSHRLQIVALLFALGLSECCVPAVRAAELAVARPRPAIHGILYNEDESNRFGFDPPGTMKPERLDQMVDELADSQVTVLLINCNAQRTNYPSKVWDTYDSIPNMQALLAAGVDPNQRMIDRCRQRKISPWISIRMNDVHDVLKPTPSFHSRFWIDHPEYWRYTDRPGWTDRCLNYGLRPVRDHMMALVREVCDRYDMDGLELDWLRFHAYFRDGEEVEQGRVLTQWMAEVREVVRAAEKKRGHPIWLVPRVPARPEVSQGIGLDAVAWAKQGIIDHLIVAPFLMTDFDIPVDQWNQLLRGTRVGVTAGLEERIQPSPFLSQQLSNTPERRRGAAAAMLGRGSQGIYLFNYYEVGKKMPYLLKEMGSLKTLARKDRSYVVTFTDIIAPGTRFVGALPKQIEPGKTADFALFIGPKPRETAKAEVALSMTAEKPGEKCKTAVTLNGWSSAAADGLAFGSAALSPGYNTIRVANLGSSPVTVGTVELRLQFPTGEKDATKIPVPDLTGAAEPAQPSAADPKPSGEAIRKLTESERVIATRGEGYFPVMIKLKDGSLGAVIRGGAPHIGIAGRLDFIRSTDGGRTWSKPVVAVDSPWDDRNPALGQMPDGTLVLAYAEAHSYTPEGKFSIAAGPYLPFLVTSNDGGQSWSAKRPFYAPWPNPSPYGKIAICRDGTALMNIYQMPTGITGILRSKDNGKTWGDYSLIRKGAGADETQVIELPDGRLLAFIRMDNADGVHGLRLAESDDHGYTWPRVRELMPLSLHPYDVTLLHSGDLLMCFGNRRMPGQFGVSAVLSKDQGRTWNESHRVAIGWDSLNNDTGYPSTVQLDDGTIVTMYYAVGTASSPDTQAIVVRYTEKQLVEAMSQTK
jgi:uncharacterized lipoprotein YddW (UPF0748 family)